MDLSSLMPQQREIVTTLDGPLFVSAGAGSGKTFTLTRRILWALSEDSGPYLTSLDQVLAITFTRDAAAEIRERVRAALIEAGMERAALSVDDAWISTIHGMCARILRAHALELGIDPEFGIVEDTDELIGAAIERVLARADGGGGAAGELSALLAWYPLKAEGGPAARAASTSVEGIVRRLLELACTLPDGMDGVHLYRGTDAVASLADAYRACLDASPKAAQIARDAMAAIDAYLASERTVGDVVRCMMSCDIPRPSKALPKEQLDLLRADVANTFTCALLACGSDALDSLVALARDVEAEYRALKREASVLDNNDLLRLTYLALRDHPAIRAAYADRFRMVMIDEFQDTDQQQVDLIGFLTDGGRRLCTVGDAQQSIYRFRGAEVEVFRRQEQRMAAPTAGGTDAAAAGKIVRLVKNFRSHAEILDYVARVFDGEHGGLMRGFLDLEPHDGRTDELVAPASRRQALLVVGGAKSERTEMKAAAIAARFRALADAGQPAGDMVLLLGAMTQAGVYAEAIRAQGLDCVIAGGSVFSSTPEVAAMRALVWTLANPADAAQGLAPLLTSPLFALGAKELLALATAYDPATGETRRRNLDAGVMSDDDAPGLEGLALVERARTVLRAALARVGRDPVADIVREVVRASGWMVRLAERGPEGRAVAANVLKALDLIDEAQAEVGNAPRGIARAFDAALAAKQAPGALNERGTGAVRIMTVHASKGLEFPVVAVADCFTVKRSADRFQTRRSRTGVEAVALPARLPGTVLADGRHIPDTKVEERFRKLYGTWLAPDALDEVCATGSAAEAFVSMREESLLRELEERARLLYVAMTRAREVLILAMDAGVGTRGKPELTFDDECDLTRSLLERILPDEGRRLDADRLVFAGSTPGDYELIACRDFMFAGTEYPANVEVEESPVPTDAPAEGPDSFTLVRPKPVDYTVVPAERPARDAYSYSSMSAALHEEGEDRAFASGQDGEAQASSLRDEAVPAAADEAAAAGAAVPEVLDVIEASDSVPVVEPGEDPTALGSAFHAAAQWLIETDSERVPTERIDAQARYWGTSEAQRIRLEAALRRWEASRMRAELRSWPCVRAEVPFFSLGMDDDEVRERFGTFAEGAIDALATDPARPGEALVIDYKTGGSPQETPSQLQDKHALQARVYADVLHRAGYARVRLAFVRVEVPDADDPTQPQVVTYDL